ncbi:hypothetical protein M514_02220 [Trichuris suis]|uniref:Queuosine 5'-phosphate N-glycosylase/hydrolase n=1 Tax=Trichuris suis TaxID=68888 RepID=A0A085NKS0_9BILA|nr:hypothetical protein M514_02220 [Trichuris suis]
MNIAEGHGLGDYLAHQSFQDQRLLRKRLTPMLRGGPTYKPWDCDYLTKNDILDPENTISFVASACEHSKLCIEKFDKIAHKFADKVKEGWLCEDSGKPFGLPLHVFNDVDLPLQKSLNRWFFVCSMSFSFWSPYLPGTPKYLIKDPDGRLWKGGKALMVRFNDLLQEGRDAIEDDRRAGRPATATCEGTLPLVRNLVEGDRRITIRRIARMAGISLHSAFGILHETLGLRKLSAQWDPKALREEQLVRRVNLSRELLMKIEANETGFFDRIVTGDANITPRCGIPLDGWALKDMPFSVFNFLFANAYRAVPPMMVERWESIKEVCTVLDEKFEGQFYNCVLQSESNPLKLLSLMLENFPCYRDHAEYGGRKISFLMKAQMLIVGVSRILHEFNDVAAFDIYPSFSIATTNRVIQMMRFYGLLEPSPSVETKMQRGMEKQYANLFVQRKHELFILGELFKFGEPEEVEMRALASRCVELLTLRVNEKLKSDGSDASVTYMDVDYIIDRDRCENVSTKRFGQIYFPKVRCIFY